MIYAEPPLSYFLLADSTTAILLGKHVVVILRRQTEDRPKSVLPNAFLTFLVVFAHN